MLIGTLPNSRLSDSSLLPLSQFPAMFSLLSIVSLLFLLLSFASFFHHFLSSLSFPPFFFPVLVLSFSTLFCALYTSCPFVPSPVVLAASSHALKRPNLRAKFFPSFSPLSVFVCGQVGWRSILSEAKEGNYWADHLKNLWYASMCVCVCVCVCGGYWSMGANLVQKYWS